jgi:hypothetical protein
VSLFDVIPSSAILSVASQLADQQDELKVWGLHEGMRDEPERRRDSDVRHPVLPLD